MKNLYLLLLFLSSHILVNAQTIKGQVVDSETKEPLVDAHVFLENESEGTLTNKNGNFTLVYSRELKRSDKINISYLGYKTAQIHYSKKKENPVIYLFKENLTLNEVEIIKKNKLKSRIKYQSLSPMNLGRYSFGSVVIDNKIYALGGDIAGKINHYKKLMEERSEIDLMEFLLRSGGKISNDKALYNDEMIVYDFNTNQWKSEQIEFRKRANHKLIFNKKENKIIILGGSNVSQNGRFIYHDNNIEVLDLNNKKVQMDNSNPHKTLRGESFVYEDNLILMGGALKEKQSGKIMYSDEVHLLDLKDGLWYELEKMPEGKEITGVLIEDKIYVFGNFNNGRKTKLMTFDLISGKWKNEGIMFDKLNNPAVTNNENIIYLFEGGKIITYNINSKELKQFPIGLDLFESNIHFSNNKLYILGGYTQTSYSLNPSNKLFSIDLSEFNTTKTFKYKVL